MQNGRLNILVVEDEFVNARFVEQMVSALGYVVVACVDSIAKALSVVEEYHVDIMMMDINLKGDIDGITGAELLNKGRDIPIIYMSAFGDSQTIQDAMQTNIYAYLHKPFDAQDIESALSITVKRTSNAPQIEEETISTSIGLGRDYSYDIPTQTLLKSGQPLSLTRKESSIVYHLAKNIDRNISYDYLIEYIWDSKDISNSTVRDCMSRLRRKTPLLNIVNIIGIGYCLKTTE